MGLKPFHLASEYRIETEWVCRRNSPKGTIRVQSNKKICTETGGLRNSLLVTISFLLSYFLCIDIQLNTDAKFEKKQCRVAFPAAALPTCL